MRKRWLINKRAVREVARAAGASQVSPTYLAALDSYVRSLTRISAAGARRVTVVRVSVVREVQLDLIDG